MKKIMLISTGGTISARGMDRIDLKDYISGSYTGTYFLDQIPEIREIALVDVDQLANQGSTNITTWHWLELKKKVDCYLNEMGYDGVVITHGTNTLEETAYFLHLTVKSDKPIVFVGSQRPFDSISSDASLNLLNAFRVAVDSNSYGKGVLVVLNDEINCAREVTKTNTYRLETFNSGQIGFLGYIDPDKKVVFYRSPLRRHTLSSEFSSLSINSLPEVGIIYSYAGANGDLINYMANSGKYAGIIMAGTGAGRCSSAEDEALRLAVEKGLTVVRSSRVGSGRVVQINDFKKFPSVTADNLSPQKARILLSLALCVYKNVNDIQRVFDEY